MQLTKMRIFKAFSTTVLWYNIIEIWLVQKNLKKAVKKAKKKSAMASAGIRTSSPTKCWSWESGALDHCTTEACKRIQSISTIYTRQNFIQISDGLHGL